MTLLELLIALTITGILASISYPLYTHHIVRVRRANAEVALMEIAARLEEYYSEQQTYVGANPQNIGIPDIAKKAFYEIKIIAQENNYLIRATPTGPQQKADTQCGALSIDALGQKHVTGASCITDCW